MRRGIRLPRAIGATSGASVRRGLAQSRTAPVADMGRRAHRIDHSGQPVIPGPQIPGSSGLVRWARIYVGVLRTSPSQMKLAQPAATECAALQVLQGAISAGCLPGSVRHRLGREGLVVVWLGPLRGHLVTGPLKAKSLRRPLKLLSAGEKTPHGDPWLSPVHWCGFPIRPDLTLRGINLHIIIHLS